MGIVIRKSLATTLFSYVGIVIGYINLLYFFPKVLSTSEIGLYRLILDTALLLAPFAQSGITQGIIKFYPSRLLHKEKKEFELLALLILLFSVTVFSAALWIFKDQILSVLFSQNKDKVKVFYDLLIFLIISMSLFAFFEGFSRANVNIVLVNFLRDIYIRLLTTLSIFLYFKGYLNYEELVYSLLIIYGSATLVLCFYTISKHKITARSGLSGLTFKGVAEIIKYNFFMVITAGSNLIVGKIDSLMVSAFLGLSENGIYQIMLYVAVVVEIPKRAVGQIAVSLYSKAFAKNNFEEVKILYYKTAINQLIIGLIIYLGLVINLDNLFFFIPNGEIYELGKWVVVIIGASRVIDMAAGSNSELIIMSKHYHFNVWAIGSLAILTIFTNYLLIPLLGMNGAALASLLSLILFNLVKLIYIRKKFGTQPFSIQTLKVLGTGIIALAVGLMIPVIENHFLDLIIRSIAVSVVYGVMIYASQASEEINNFLNNTFKLYFRSNKNLE